MTELGDEMRRHDTYRSNLSCTRAMGEDEWHVERPGECWNIPFAQYLPIFASRLLTPLISERSLRVTRGRSPRFGSNVVIADEYSIPSAAIPGDTYRVHRVPLSP
jgi:hypothetical protein